jgi:hypothetical protein
VSTAFWLALIGNLVVVAVGYGALQAKVASLKEAVNELRTSRDKHGERIGRLDTKVQIIESHQVRRPTAAIGAPAPAGDE